MRYFMVQCNYSCDYSGMMIQNIKLIIIYEHITGVAKRTFVFATLFQIGKQTVKKGT